MMQNLGESDRVRLRPVGLDDLSRMYELHLDPESNRMAGTIPRTREAFDAHWAKVLQDPAIVAKAILFDGTLVGMISCFQPDGRDHIGYWIDRAFWGKGIASEALVLMLRGVPRRPLFATADISNEASLRILKKCGFVLERTEHSPATDRFLEREVAHFSFGNSQTESQ